MSDEHQQPPTAEQAEAVLLDPGERPSGLVIPGAGRAEEPGQEQEQEQEPEDIGESVEQPAKVMRIGSMVKQLLDEVRSAPLDEASRARMREIYEQSIHELAGALSPDLASELDRMTLPFDSPSPSDAELRIAQAQLVGWLEGLFHGIQATLMAQQMAARAQLEELRQRQLPGPNGSVTPSPGTYL
jgi:proteasome activator-like protein